MSDFIAALFAWIIGKRASRLAIALSVAVFCGADDRGPCKPHYVNEMVEVIHYSRDNGNARLNQESWVVHRFTRDKPDVLWFNRTHAHIHFDGVDSRDIDRLKLTGMARIRGVVVGWRNGDAIIIVESVQVLWRVNDVFYDCE